MFNQHIIAYLKNLALVNQDDELWIEANMEECEQTHYLMDKAQALSIYFFLHFTHYTITHIDSKVRYALSNFLAKQYIL